MLVDSGSNISVIRRSAILKFGLDILQMYPSDELTHIQVANKQNIEIVGIIKTSVQVQGHNLTVRFHVVDNLHTDFILGVETLKVGRQQLISNKTASELMAASEVGV